MIGTSEIEKISSSYEPYKAYKGMQEYRVCTLMPCMSYMVTFLLFRIPCKITKVVFEIFRALQAPEQKGIRYSDILIGKKGLVCVEGIFLRWRR